MRLLSALVIFFFVTHAAARSETGRKLVVLAIDGLDARYIQDADKLHLKIPNLRKLAKTGAISAGVTGVWPSDSWAAGTTLATGVPPAEHGVLGSQTPQQNSAVLTLWQIAASAHLKTALLFWPASVSAQADYNCPQFWEGTLTADLPFDVISQRCTPGLVQRITSVYPVFSKSMWNDSTALTGLRYLLQYEQPDLSMVHITDLGQEQNETGALSLYAREVLENQDEMIGQAIANLPSHTQIAIVSDHGFETEDYVVRPRVLIGSKTVQVREGLIGALNGGDAAALRKLAGSRKWGIARELSIQEARASVPEASQWSAAFITHPNFVATEGMSGRAVVQGSHKGVHSFWPARPNFRSTFILSGDQVKAIHLPEISILQVAPTLADVLGVKLHSARAPSLWPQISK